MNNFMHNINYFYTRNKNRVYKYALINIHNRQLTRPISFIAKKIRNAYLGYPSCLLVELTNICNIKCPLCPSPPWMDSRNKGFLSYENFLKIIDNSKDIIYRMNMSQGGEPFLNREICKMVKYAHSFNLYTMVFTNATLLDEQLSKDIIDAGCEHILISFDGFSKNTYESFRQGADFEKVIENIKTLGRAKTECKSMKPFIEIQWIVTKYNETEVSRAKKEIGDWQGINAFTVKTLCLNEHFLNDTEVERIKFDYLPSYNIRQHYKDRKRSRLHCPMLHMPVVLWDGSLSICCYDFQGNYIVGNLVREKLKTICRNETYRRLLKQMRNKQLPLCKRCPA